MCQHNRKFEGISPNAGDNYSQGKFDDEQTIDNSGFHSNFLWAFE